MVRACVSRSQGEVQSSPILRGPGVLIQGAGRQLSKAQAGLCSSESKWVHLSVRFYLFSDRDNGLGHLSIDFQLFSK